MMLTEPDVESYFLPESCLADYEGEPWAEAMKIVSLVYISLWLGCIQKNCMSFLCVWPLELAQV